MTRTLLSTRLALLVSIAGASMLAAYQGPIQIVSHQPGSPVGGNGPSRSSDVSWDGRYVVFDSTADNLVANDDNGRRDVFLWDRKTGDLTAISVVNPADPESSTANDDSNNPSISADGKFVVFTSHASDLPGANDECNTFLWDREAETIEIVSVKDSGHGSGPGNGACGYGTPGVSDDGVRVIFASTSCDLVPDDSQTCWPYDWSQIFVRNRRFRTTRRLTDPVDPTEERPNDHSSDPVISADGRSFAFRTAATNIPGTPSCCITTVVERDGAIFGIDDGASQPITGKDLGISGDGSTVVFSSTTAHVPEDTDGKWDAYAWTPQGLKLLSGDVPGNPHLKWPAIDDRGRNVVFESANQVWHYNMESGETTPVIVRTDGSPPGFGAYDGHISGDGRNVVFTSRDHLLVEGDDNGNQYDVFFRGDLLDLVDPFHELLDKDSGKIDSEAHHWARPDLTEVSSVVADGVTPIIIRYFAHDVPGTVTFSIDSPFADSGTLSTRVGFASGAPERLQTLESVATEPTQAGEVAFALYEPPLNFVRQGGAPTCPGGTAEDTCRESRLVTIAVDFTPTSGSRSSAIAQIPLLRPPTMLVHGLWPKKQTWELDLMSDTRFHIYTHDYKSTSGLAFADNLLQPYLGTRQLLSEVRARRTAVTQIDYVGHSMGGILGRIFVGRPPGYDPFPDYAPGETYGQGYFHKLITVGSPHRGSPHANCYERLPSAIRALIASVQGYRFGGVDALEDLAVGSAVNLALPDANVFSHAVAGLGGRALFDDAPLVNWHPAFAMQLDILETMGVPTHDALFPASSEHDLVVAQASQEGRLAPDHTTGLLEELHIGPNSETNSDDANWVLDSLLNEPIDPLFGSFASAFPFRDPADIDPSEQLSPTLCDATWAQGIGELAISGPVVAAPGDTVTITVDADFNTPVPPPIDRVVAYTRFSQSAAQSVAGPFFGAQTFDIQMDVPADEHGTVQVEVIAFASGASEYYLGPGITFEVIPTAELESLRVEPDPMFLDYLTPSQNLVVHGTYDDGVERRIQGPEAGTTYTSDDPLVATVDAYGKVEAINLGSTAILVENSGVEDHATIHVGTSRLRHLDPLPSSRDLWLRVASAEPGATIAFYWDTDAGSDEVPGCPGLTFGLDQANLEGTATASSDGTATIKLNGAIQGTTYLLQAVDESLCAVSNLVEADW